MVKKPTAAKSASAAFLKTSRTDLFLPEELEEFFEGNKPQAGDVLLLDGDGVTSKLARLTQGGSRYSHVGLVIGFDLYIDAVGKEGVCVRRIADMRDPKHEYALDRCKVAARDAGTQQSRMYLIGARWAESAKPNIHVDTMPRDNTLGEESGQWASKTQPQPTSDKRPVE